MNAGQRADADFFQTLDDLFHLGNVRLISLQDQNAQILHRLNVHFAAQIDRGTVFSGGLRIRSVARHLWCLIRYGHQLMDLIIQLICGFCGDAVVLNHFNRFICTVRLIQIGHQLAQVIDS